ncbi:hypothetical protein QTP88_004613 [Uroleucon formosanum]
MLQRGVEQNVSNYNKNNKLHHFKPITIKLIIGIYIPVFSISKDTIKVNNLDFCKNIYTLLQSLKMCHIRFETLLLN